MKKFFFVIFLCLILSPSYSQDSIYFLNIDYLLNNSLEGKKVVNKLQKINDQNILKIQNYKNELEKQEEEINKIKNIITEAEIEKKVKDLKNKIVLYRNQKDKIFNDYNDLKNKELESFFKKITPYIEEYMKINSIKFILDKKNIFIADAKYDITNSLIDFLNERIKSD